MRTLWHERLVGLTCIALFLLLTSPANAWEFSMAGVFTWEYFQFSQLGTRGFFGPFNQDNSSVAGTVNLAARNGWLGHEITSVDVHFDNLTSGSDVAANYMYTTICPKVKANEALSLQGSYRIGSWASPSQDTSLGQLNFSRYLNSTAAGLTRSFSPGYWNTLYVTAALPWGTVMIGKQPNTIGLGFLIDAEEHSNEGVILVVPFGPLYMGMQYYPWQRGVYIQYPLITDRSGANQPRFSAFLLYFSGNISAQTYIEYANSHQGPESQLLQGDVQHPGRSNFTPKDITSFYGFTNFRYIDGRFFFNAEVGFRQDVLRQSRSESDALLPRTRYWELWGGMIECGMLSGPAKITFLWAYYPGYDRRAGQLIDRQPSLPGALLDSGVIVYRPYSLLLGYNYGSGNASTEINCNHGFISDASTYGVRLDYAVAANLNAYATFLYARRVSQGYGWGYIRPNPSTTPTSPLLQYGLLGNLEEALDFSFAPDAPNVLERDLGCEIGGGIDWKLLEGYVLRARVAYWKPGDWFKYVCVDRRQPNWDVPTASNRWGINPNRDIDPIVGTYVTLIMNF